jgi:hypothetical protein
MQVVRQVAQVQLQQLVAVQSLMLVVAVAVLTAHKVVQAVLEVQAVVEMVRLVTQTRQTVLAVLLGLQIGVAVVEAVVLMVHQANMSALLAVQELS